MRRGADAFVREKKKTYAAERKIVTKETHQGCLSFSIISFSALFQRGKTCGSAPYEYGALSPPAQCAGGGLTHLFPFSIFVGADDSVRPFLRQGRRVPAFTRLSACSAGRPAKQAPCPAFGAGSAGTCRSTGSRRPHGPPAGCPRPPRPTGRTKAPGSSG